MALAVGIGNPGLSMTSASWRLLPGVGMLGMLSVSELRAQECATSPAVPAATITITHNRDQMMCQQHLTFLVLPPQQGIAWPRSDLTPPTNAGHLYRDSVRPFESCV
jgi:hypothetical protein